jgi:hypothetical protein
MNKTEILLSFVMAGFAMSAMTAPVQAESIGDGMVNYLRSQVGKRLGGGEAAHVATEALRVAGGEFSPCDLGPDTPSTGDAVWGTLVKIITSDSGWTDSNPDAPVLAGDVIQYRDARFSDGERDITFALHTAVVAVVDGSGRPRTVFQQNGDGNRSLRISEIDVTRLTEGWLRIYRPVPRATDPNVYKFTVVNNSSKASVVYSIVVDVYTVSTVTLTAANTEGSYRVHKISTTGNVPAVLLENYESIYVQDAKGNEIGGSESAGTTVTQIPL